MKFYGRNRNCYKLAVRAVNKAFYFATQARKLDPDFMKELRAWRLDAACTEHDATYQNMNTNLIKCNIQLNSDMLTNLAIWEPKTFKSLTEIAQVKNKKEAPEHLSKHVTAPDTVINKDFL